jgi:hypothetical protein
METCDECGPAVKAEKRIELPSGRTLTYCDHHATAYNGKLRELGAFTFQIDGSCEPSLA